MEDFSIEPAVDAEECYQYIVSTLSQNEQLPYRFNIKQGTDLMLERLEQRYGYCSKDNHVGLLRQHLNNRQGTDAADWRLWRQWRADFEITGTFSTPPATASCRSRVLAWDPGEPQQTLLSQPTTRRRRSSSSAFLAEGESVEYENRVDLANGSRPAIGLLAQPNRVNGSLRLITSVRHRTRRHPEAQTPWEGKEYWQHNVA